MRGAGSRGRDADAELAREFGIGRGHEGRHFLVARLDERDLILLAPQRAEHSVDAVTGVAEYLRDAPGQQALDDKISDGSAHEAPFGSGMERRAAATSGAIRGFCRPR